MKQTVWFKKPARIWKKALPLGNGYMGAMVFGGVRQERIALNDCTLWSGYPKDQTNSESLKYLDEVRQLVFDGKCKDADKLCMEKLCGDYHEAFLPLGDIYIKFSKPSSKNYKRKLDLETAVHTTENGKYIKESFCSYPDKVLVYRIKNSSKFSVKISAKSKLKSTVVADKNSLSILGNAPDYVAPKYLGKIQNSVQYNEHKGMCFCSRTELKTDGTVSFEEGCLKVNDAKEVLLITTTATGFKAYNEMPETDVKYAENICKNVLKSVKEKTFDELKQRHIEDFSKVFKNQDFSLCEENDLPVNKLIKSAKIGRVENALLDLFYHFGKYLIVSGSRQGTQPLTLQGIWNEDVRAPWSSEYTVNINTEMNYWSLTKSGLDDCAEPFFRFVYEVVQSGKKTAKVNYGCGGSSCNHNVDIWRKTTPVKGNPCYMYAPLCGAWLANEVFSHYKNGKLLEYKEQIEEIVTQTAQFCNDYLVFHNGQYVTAPSASPEASFVQNGNCDLDYASNFEMGIIRQAFANYKELFVNGELVDDINDKLSKMKPYECGSTGLLEWHEDKTIAEKGHRHFSPLYSFYPANVLKYYENKQETEWVRKLFNYRVENSKQFIGWNAAWAMCLAGRLHDSKTAKSVMHSMMAHSVFYNLFAVHPPSLFQIDGNLGFVAGVNELLLYEENGVVDLLPALPDSWNKGFVKNMVVNGIKISFEWKNKKIVKVESDAEISVANINLADNVSVGELVKIVERQ